ncbi:unnamed protein product [Oikopleura dioica]|uniref:Attractin/MKLN-like beta-propeller domain-containing protein n=1 Tax=Oikopleura dioica TaxID=34765 RepID=E4X847_OIKDI|nr:unnamed protein product [Oikopleura dioica]CBY32521.1 unnamed protein product [Oikopleura dioica]
MAIRDFKLLLVGGWDGLKRRHQCWFFNLRTHQWILLRETIPSGDVEQSPAGLSSHSLCPISADSYVVTGREGSVRFQKRFACIFSVKISEAEGEVPKYEYARVSHQMGSRSGHSSHYAASFCRGRKKSPALLMIGGRNEETIDSMPLASFSNVQTPNYDVRQKEILYSVKMKLNSIKPAFRIHACVTVDNWIILHGGLVFNKIRDNVLGDSLIIYDSNTSRWYTIKISAGKSCILKRFGHSLASINGKFYILGGSQSDETIISQMVELVIEN